MSFGTDTAPSGWQWPEEIASKPEKKEYIDIPPPGSFEAEQHEAPPNTSAGERPAPEQDPLNPESSPPKSERHYEPRTCRICLEEVMPSFEPVVDGVGSFLNPSPKVEFISADPASGRLIRPCKCRGSQAYVHEGCLQEWRHSDPSYGRRNFWECPTCKFRYRLERMKWSRFISSTLAQLILTTVIMVVTVFLLGFVADPIISLYLEPTATIASITMGGGLGALEFEDDVDLDLDFFDGWVVHFVKGLTSIGVLGFVKVLWAVNPFTWWNLRTGGFLGGGRGRRNRDDSNFTFILIIGIITFMFGVWTWVRKWSRRTLEKAGERVVDVQEDDDNDDEHQA
ncbi:RING protein [Venustampulla echinocandica]|uniref:RING protein n=1 Tax=Venustampulla echinocandica TaxID=2656787 RepID=A0A370TU08_9HELO|nr:RING protein [Venustampulla echinocandica]RDL39009.1 RING protein [Venustampulla echinocandica]